MLAAARPWVYPGRCQGEAGSMVDPARSRRRLDAVVDVEEGPTMTPDASDRHGSGLISRRTMIGTAAAAAGAAILAPTLAPSTVQAQSDTDYEPGSRRYPDIDIV